MPVGSKRERNNFLPDDTYGGSNDTNSIHSRPNNTNNVPSTKPSNKRKYIFLGVFTIAVIVYFTFF